MRRTVFLVFLVVLMIASSPASAAAGDGDLKILTYPIGLVTGEQVFELDLGADRKPADLYLDGDKVCTATAAEPRCKVASRRSLRAVTPRSDRLPMERSRLASKPASAASGPPGPAPPPS